MLVSLLGTGALLPAAVDETVVERHVVDDIDDVRVVDAPLWDGAAALLLVPGAVLARDGGPLSSSRPVLRGLANARLAVDVLGLSLTDPAAGVVDAALLPWGLGDVVVDVGAGDAIAGSLSIRRPRDGVDVAVGAGPLATLRARARATTALDDGHAGAFVDLGTTRGDFVFRHDDTLGTGGPLDVRRNNDHRRANAALFAALGGGGSVVDVAGVVGAHEGGVPGFSTAPLDLRAREATAAAGARWTLREQGARLSVVVDGTGSDRSVRSSTLDSRLVGARAGGGLVAVVPLAERLQASLDVRLERGGVVDVVERVSGDAALGVVWSVPVAAMASELRLDAHGRVGVVDDDDPASVAARQTMWLPQGHARVSVVHDDLAAFVGVTRTARAPTLDERFAPQGFVRGNPALRPEAVAEIEGGVVVEAPRAGVRLVAHASTLDDVIVPVNRNAFEVVPENTGRAQRAGLDASATLRPTPLVEVTLAASLLSTALLPPSSSPTTTAPPTTAALASSRSSSSSATPLPGAPPVTLALAPRLGTAEAWVRTTIAARGPVSSNLFGTVTSPGSVLVDLDARLPVGRGVGLALFVQNAFDVLDARDQNLLPLPGRLVFVSLELHA